MPIRILLLFVFARTRRERTRDRNDRRPMHLSMTRSVSLSQEDCRALRLAPVRTLPSHWLGAIVSYVVLKPFPREALIEDVEDDGTVAVLQPIVAVIEIVAVGTAAVLTPGV